MTMLMIATDGRTLSYDVSGAGAAIVFVAGLGERGTYWMAQVAAFSSAFQVVIFDHRGVGASEGQPPHKIEQWAADPLRLIGHLGLDRVHLVGHSTGGAIAQVLAADHSDRVVSLVLGATWARLDARLRRLFMFRCASRWVLIGVARPGTRRRKSRQRASTRCSHELAPTANIVAALVNPKTPAETQSTDLQTAARTLGLKAEPSRRRLDRAARQRAAVRRPPVDNPRVRPRTPVVMLAG